MSSEGRTERNDFNGVKIFSATMAQERDRLGDRITDWVRKHSEYEITDTIVTQSSDEAFHCLAITIFYREPL
jgi:putative lipoic acid-binding regulatory protein